MRVRACTHSVRAKSRSVRRRDARLGSGAVKHGLLIMPIGKKTPSRPGPPVALVALAASDDTAPLRSPARHVLCAPAPGFPADARPAIHALGMLPPHVPASQLLHPFPTHPRLTDGTSPFPTHRRLTDVPLSWHHPYGRTMTRAFLLMHILLRAPSLLWIVGHLPMLPSPHTQLTPPSPTSH